MQNKEYDRACYALKMNLKIKRTQKGLTQQDLANRAGLDRTFISLLENKKQTFSLESLSRVAYALDTTVGELFL